MRTLFGLVTASVVIATSAAAAPMNVPSPAVQYTVEQYQSCGPILLTDTDAAAKKSSLGEAATATAISRITAPEGYFIDTREGAFSYTQGGHHMNRPGTPSTQKRLNDLFAMELSLKNEAHRGKSLRFGRNVSAYNGLSGYAVKKTSVCLVALGFL